MVQPYATGYGIENAFKSGGNTGMMSYLRGLGASNPIQPRRRTYSPQPYTGPSPVNIRGLGDVYQQAWQDVSKASWEGREQSGRDPRYRFIHSYLNQRPTYSTNRETGWKRTPLEESDVQGNLRAIFQQYIGSQPGGMYRGGEFESWAAPYLKQAESLQQQEAEQKAQAQREKQMEDQMRWPSYEQAMSGYELDPLNRLYTGQRYSEQPISKDEYEYMRLAEQYGGTNQYGQPTVDPNVSQSAYRNPYDPQSGELPINQYAYYRWLEGDLKRRRDKEMQEQREMMRNQSMGQRENERIFLEGDRMARQERIREAQAAAQQNDLQSLAARGFYQTPYSYQNT
jgi:hypothetical protein